MRGASTDGERSIQLGRPGVGLAIGALTGLLIRDLDLPTLLSFWGDREPLVVAVTLVVGLGWCTRLWKAFLAILLALVLSWLTVAFTPLSSWLAAGLVRRDAIRAADAVFVFSSRMQRDAEPTSDSLARLLGGIELIAQGHSRTLVLSELASPERSLSEYARPLLERLDVEAQLVLVGPVRNTRDEALGVAGLCRSHGLCRVLAVTSPTHSSRACASLEALGLEVISVPAVEPRFDLETLDRPSERLQAFGSVIHERVGRLVYERRGWIRPGA
jgi:uncharacterized SAM-binding protein YcdF (DUF218 family)